MSSSFSSAPKNCTATHHRRLDLKGLQANQVKRSYKPVSLLSTPISRHYSGGASQALASKYSALPHRPRLLCCAANLLQLRWDSTLLRFSPPAARLFRVCVSESER